MPDAEPNAPVPPVPPDRAHRSSESLRHAIGTEVTGLSGSVARRLLGDAPGASAFATGLLWVAAGLALQIVGLWLAALLPADVTLTRFFVMLSTLYTALVGLVLLCGVMTMLAGAVRYGVGATDR